MTIEKRPELTPEQIARLEKLLASMPPQLPDDAEMRFGDIAEGTSEESAAEAWGHYGVPHNQPLTKGQYVAWFEAKATCGEG